MTGIAHNPGVDGDVVTLDPERSLVYGEVDSVTGGIVFSAGVAKSMHTQGLPAHTAVAIGDSITAGSGANYDDSYLTWAEGLSGGRIKVVKNAGVSGNTTQQMIDRFVADVVPMGASILIELGGINDFNAGATVDSVFSNRKAIWDMALSVGMRVIAGTVMPLASGHASYSAANQQKYLTLNRRIREYCRVTNGMEFFDSAKAVTDALSTTGQPASGMLKSDNIHPSPKGARAIGAELAAVVTQIAPPSDVLPSSCADSRLVDAANPQRIDNPTFVQGTGGSLLAGASGTVAQYWNAGASNGSPTSVASIVSRSDGRGNNQRLVVTASADNDAGVIRTGNIASNVAIGDTLRLSASIKCASMSGVKAVRCYFQYKIDGGSYQYAYAIGGVQTGTYDNTDFEIVVTSDDTLLSGAVLNELYVNAQVIFSGAGSATLELGRCGLVRI